MACARRRVARGQRRRNSRHRRRCRQRPGRTVRRAVRRDAGRRATRCRIVIDGMPRAAWRSPSGGGSARPSCRRSGSATRPRRASAVRQRAADRACRERYGRGTASSIARRRRSPPSIASPRPTTCARESPTRRRVSLSGGNLQKFVVGREILREPRRAGRQPADLGRRRGRGGGDPPGDRSISPRAAPPCWSSARTSTNCSRSPTAWR